MQREGGCLQPVCLFTRHKLRAGWGLPDGFTLLVDQLILVFGDCECPWDGHRVARLGRLSPEVNLVGIGGESSLMPPRPLSAPTTTTTPGLGRLSLTEFLCVGGHKNRRWGPGEQMVCARLYLLGAWGRARRSSHTKPALSPPAAGLHSFPARSFHPPPQPTRGTPSSRSRQGRPRWGKEEATGQQFKGGS